MKIKIIFLLIVCILVLLNFSYNKKKVFNNRKIIIEDGKLIKEIITNKIIVGEILNDGNIVIEEDDIVYPTINSKIGNENKIIICRIIKEIFTEFQPIKKETIYYETNKLPANKTIVIKEGADGLLKKIQRITKINNNISKIEIIESSVYKKPINKIILIGKSNKIEKLNKKIEKEKSIIKFKTTAYTPGPESCAPYNDGFTAIGLVAGYGIAAVDPNIIPLGSKIYIPGYGYAIAADVGAAIKKHSIDLCFYNVQIAKEYGVKYKNIFVLN